MGNIGIQQTINDQSVSRVVSILESNIQQWGFIESQLLEPNVNLGMPEIFIPLRHLTTTLEVLGTIQFMKNELTGAKSTLERACPLLELLPSNTEEHQASGCYKLLKKVYKRLHRNSNGNDDLENDIDDDVDSLLKERQMLEGLVGALTGNGFDTGGEVGTDWLNRNNDDKHTTKSTSKRSNRHKAKSDDEWSSSDDEFDKGDSDSSSSEDLANDREWTHPPNMTDYDDTAARRTAAIAAGVDENFDMDRRLDELRSPFDHLRGTISITGEHLDAVDVMAGPSGRNFGTINTHDDDNNDENQDEDDEDNNDENQDEDDEDNSFSDTHNNNVDVEKSENLNADEIQEQNDDPKLLSRLEKVKAARERLEKKSKQVKSGSTATTTIAGLSETMWQLLVNYVKEDDTGRRDILHQARQHYADLHVNINEYDSPEVVANLALADAYLAVMHKATHDGFSFIRRELRDFGHNNQVLDHKLLSRHNYINTLDNDEEFISMLGELSPSEKSRLIVLTAFEKAIAQTPVSKFDVQRQRKIMEEAGLDIVDDTISTKSTPEVSRKSSKTKPASAPTSRSMKSSKTTAARSDTKWSSRPGKKGNKRFVVNAAASMTKTKQRFIELSIIVFFLLLWKTMWGFFLESQRRLKAGKKSNGWKRDIEDFLVIEYNSYCERFSDAWQWFLVQGSQIEYLKPIFDSLGLQPKKILQSGTNNTSNGSAIHKRSKKKDRKSKSERKNGNKANNNSTVMSTDIIPPTVNDAAPNVSDTILDDKNTNNDNSSSGDEDASDSDDELNSSGNNFRPMRHETLDTQIMPQLQELNMVVDDHGSYQSNGTLTSKESSESFTLVSKELQRQERETRIELERQQKEIELQAEKERIKERTVKEREKNIASKKAVAADVELKNAKNDNITKKDSPRDHGHVEKKSSSHATSGKTDKESNAKEKRGSDKERKNTHEVPISTANDSSKDTNNKNSRKQRRGSDPPTSSNKNDKVVEVKLNESNSDDSVNAPPPGLEKNDNDRNVVGIKGDSLLGASDMSFQPPPSTNPGSIFGGLIGGDHTKPSSGVSVNSSMPNVDIDNTFSSSLSVVGSSRPAMSLSQLDTFGSLGSTRFGSGGFDDDIGFGSFDEFDSSIPSGFDLGGLGLGSTTSTTGGVKELSFDGILGSMGGYSAFGGHTPVDNNQNNMNSNSMPPGLSHGDFNTFTSSNSRPPTPPVSSYGGNTFGSGNDNNNYHYSVAGSEQGVGSRQRGPPAVPYAAGGGDDFAKPNSFDNDSRRNSNSSDTFGPTGIEAGNNLDLFLGINNGLSSLSPGAASFSPIVKNGMSNGNLPPLPTPSETIDIVLTCSIKHMLPNSVAEVRVSSPIVNSFGVKQKDHVFSMSRSSSDPQLWGARLKIPRATDMFEYKYITVDTMRTSSDEARAIRRLNLSLVSGRQSTIELDDTFDANSQKF